MRLGPVQKKLMQAALAGLACFGVSAEARVRDTLAVCPDPGPIQRKIIMCGDDQYAADKAQECSDKVVASWKAAAADLQTQLLRASDNQNHSEADTKADYDKTIAALNAQIKYMQDATDLISTYPQAMIDYPDTDGTDEKSAPCFNEAFHKVQDIVSFLDDEIIRAKDIRKMTIAMRDTSQSRHVKFDNNLFDGLGTMVAGGVGSGKSDNGRSDVTGIREDEAKRKAVPNGMQTASMSKPKLETVPAGKSEQDPSTITRSAGRDPIAAFTTPGLGGKMDPSGIFSARGTLTESPASPRGAPVVARRSGAAAPVEDDSVGSVLWHETGAGKVLDMNGAISAVTGVEGTSVAASDGSSAANAQSGPGGIASGTLANGTASLGDGSANFGSGSGIPGRDPASLVAVGAAKGSRAVASSESDLFALVSNRYRATELFRRAHVTDVPLSGFDSNLKR